MIVYVLLVFLLIIFYNLKNNKKTEILFSIVLVILAAFRSANTGADTLSFIEDYNSIMTSSWRYVTERYNGYWGYYYLCKLVSYSGCDVWLWFGIVESFFLISIIKLINRFSVDGIYSLMIFLCNGLYVQSFNAQKQILAISFMLFAFVAFANKRFVLAGLLSLYAFVCHPTSAVFLPAFFMYYFRESKLLLPIALSFSLFLIIAGQTFLDQATLSMFVLLDNEHYEDYLVLDNTYTNTTLIFYSFSVLLPLLFTNKRLFKGPQDLEEKRKIAVLSLVFCLLCCSFQGLSAINPTLFRLAYYYSPFFMILIPNCTKLINNRGNRNLMTIIIWASYIFYFLYTNRNTLYEFQ